MTGDEARDLQMVDQQVPLSPHKGRDFATTVGPCIVTNDEVADRLGSDGRHDLKMKVCFVHMFQARQRVDAGDRPVCSEYEKAGLRTT